MWLVYCHLGGRAKLFELPWRAEYLGVEEMGGSGSGEEGG